MKKQGILKNMAWLVLLLVASLMNISSLQAQLKEKYDVGSKVCVMIDVEENIWTEGEYLGSDWESWANSDVHKVKVGQMVYSIGDFGVSPSCSSPIAVDGSDGTEASSDNEEEGKFKMGDRVCVPQSDGSSRTAMIISGYSTNWKGTGFDMGYKITYLDTKGRESLNVPQSLLTSGECP